MPIFLLAVSEREANRGDLDNNGGLMKEASFVVLSDDLHAAFAAMQKAAPKGEISLSKIRPDLKRLDVTRLVKNKPQLYE